MKVNEEKKERRQETKRKKMHEIIDKLQQNETERDIKQKIMCCNYYRYAAYT